MGSVRSPFLKTGVTCAFFNAAGYFWSFIELLIISVIGLAILMAPSTKAQGGMGVGPVELSIKYWQNMQVI